MRAALAHVAVAAHHGDLAGDHHIDRAFDAVGQRFAAAVEVVELRFRDRIIDVDRRDEQCAGFEHLVETMHAGGGLFGDALPVLHNRMPETRSLLVHALEEILDDLLFVACAGGVDPIAAVFQFIAFMNQQGRVATVVHDELRAEMAGMRERVEGAVPILLQCLALPREHGNARLRNRGRGVVLGGKNVAAGPAHRRTEFAERFNEDRRLDGHVQRAGNAHALERLRRAVFGADGHEAGHLVFGDLNGFPSPIGQREIAHLEVAFGAVAGGFGEFRTRGRKFDGCHSCFVVAIVSSRNPLESGNIQAAGHANQRNTRRFY